MREKLIALSIIKKGNWDEIYQFLRTDRQLNSIDDVAARQFVDQLNHDVVTLIDADYPAAWHEMSKPPFVVYLKGNRQLLSAEVLGIVGGKEMNEYTKKVLENLMLQLPKNVSIVTGLERGVEAFVNYYRKNRIVCLGAGFEADEFYHKQPIYHQLNADDLLMTELPPQANFDMKAYYRSYHLMSEMSQLVGVFGLASFDLRLKYLNYLTEIGKPVVVLPDRASQSTAGGLDLLNRGAKCLVQVSEVLDLLALE